MTIPSKYAVGDAVIVLIGYEWHKAIVRWVGGWSHSSGNHYPVYRVEFDDGGEVYCGNNSIEKDPL